ncbi:MAG TPA: tRNA dihydrouridine synthase DusB [Bacteroidales bacterium]|jgi:nifR3 family TIM-barrel protein|nr:tRNA dihydrouridine synthase DusB [Bacteroidales bacterium]OQC60422.1 MAG: putative tRNA-dihydrouridine synthase [Bacteroidetes bacterium ADurb.Bin012]HNQ60319.1 tRNA dihydrouridine synthase DusB [Bacteroidales bacterium]HNU21992.1 tRNA dihydrouridine synthase DusB [Bacteroidales bacterium]HNV17547.1 tRNA dihydrouridine synthase DusB [Bacteroidales bacterium]
MKIGSLEISYPFIALAPMEDITDTSFRRICKKLGADMVYTEFISSQGLTREGEKSLEKLKFSEEERPIGIQIFGNETTSMVEAAKIATTVQPDLIDINWGCPVKKVAGKGSGSGILNDIPKMISITQAVVKATHLPVTAKTRVGYDESNKPIVEITERLQDAGVAGITIHGRTRSQLFSGEADWTLIGKVKENPRIKIPIIGNGDIVSAHFAKTMLERYHVDGIMIGRAAIGNPWIFDEVKTFLNSEILLPPPNINERINVLIEHLQIAIQIKGERRAILEMRKHYSGYFKGMPNFKKIRTQLMTFNYFHEIDDFLQNVMQAGLT